MPPICSQITLFISDVLRNLLYFNLRKSAGTKLTHCRVSGLLIPIPFLSIFTNHLARCRNKTRYPPLILNKKVHEKPLRNISVYL